MDFSLVTFSGVTIYSWQLVTNMTCSQSSVQLRKSKMSASSLVELSASAVIQDRCIVDGCDLSTLPRTVLQELLLTSISQSRMLCLRSLITNWPMKHLVLQNVSGFDEPKAVLLAYCLQRTKHDLKLVDIRGCNIGESNKVKSLEFLSYPRCYKNL